MTGRMVKSLTIGSVDRTMVPVPAITVIASSRAPYVCDICEYIITRFVWSNRVACGCQHIQHRRVVVLHIKRIKWVYLLLCEVF